VCGAFGTFAHQTYAAFLRGQLSSNVRRHVQHLSMHRFVVTIASAITLSACSPKAENENLPRDQALVAALQGSWCVTEDGGKTCWAYDTFSENTISGCGVIPETNERIRATARFTVNGTKTCYQVTSTDDPENFPVGHSFCTQVMAIDDRSQTYKHLDSGELHTTFRVPKSSVVCPGDA